MISIHNKLSETLDWYHQWHSHPRHQHAHWLFFVSTALLVTTFISGEILNLYINEKSAYAGSGGIRYYGHYFVEDDGIKDAGIGLRLVDEVSSFTNIINFRYDSGAENRLDGDNVRRIMDAGVKVMLQVPFNEGQFTNASTRDAYLKSVRDDINSYGFMSSVVYFAVYEEWYTILQADWYTDYYNWSIFAGKSRDQRFAIAKTYLEQIIDDVHRIFPGIPVVIVENISPSLLPGPPPPNNLDVIGVDSYYIPDNSSCDSAQRVKFESEVIPWYDVARTYGKPIMMVPPSFILGPWKMLSECQMQWYVDLALSGDYNIESFIWFVYGSFDTDSDRATGVRDFPDLVSYQRTLGCTFLGSAYCGAIPTPRPCTSVLCGFYSLNPEGGGPGIIVEYHVGD
jgi:hypothetical protein